MFEETRKIEHRTNMVLQLLPFIGALIASATALYIAIIVNPRQRNQDRSYEQLKMKAAAYQKYLEKLTDDFGYHADKSYENVPGLGAKQRYEIARFSAIAMTYASKEALEQIERIANSRNPGQPMQKYAEEVSIFAGIIRRECYGLSDLQSHSLRKFFPVDS